MANQHAESFLSVQLQSIVQASEKTVTLALAADVSNSVHEAAERTFHPDGHRSQATDGTEGKQRIKRFLDKISRTVSGTTENDGDDDETEQWRAIRPLTHTERETIRGLRAWGSTTPSELFTDIYAHTLLPLEEDPLKGLVSPSLTGGLGVVLLSIISVIPDIIQHHADLIVRAQHEIFLATNFWEASSSAGLIVDAIKELSRRVIDGKRQPVVIKLMYDRGNPAQIVSPHQSVKPETYTGDKVKLPYPSEIPGVLLEVQNYHRPPVGTFHAKYMVIDRHTAILNSNNIQDRVNLEMMLHIEGPIVQSFYDLALLSWSEKMDPPLPLLVQAPVYATPLDRRAFHWGTEHPLVNAKGDLEDKARQARVTLQQHHKGDDVGTEVTASPRGHANDGPTWDQDNEAEATRVDGALGSQAAVNEHLNTGNPVAASDQSAVGSEVFKPIALLPPHDPVPMALVNRPPHGKPGHGDTWVPQDFAFLAGFKLARERVFIQTPTFNAKPVVEAAIATVKRGILVEIYADLGFNDEGELLPYQGGTNEMVAAKMYGALTEAEKPNLRIYWYTGKDQRTPLNAKNKSRNCHVKLMIIDSCVIIQGNGNQDTQSWFHSQEVNVMIDSPLLASHIREQIDSNQNTLHYGLVDPRDGVWRDSQGHTLPGQKSPPKGPFKSLVGVKGAIQRVRGEGGF